MTVHTVERLEDLPPAVPDGTVVVVDVITASTSIVALLDSGARYVRPFADADAARAFGREHEDAVLVGERRGAPLAGFDFVPLPTRLQGADLSGRPVAIRTTNGTRAVDHVDEADRLLVGSTVNARAVAETLVGQTGDSYLVAAGDTGVPAPEDTAGTRLIEAHCENGPETAERVSLRRQIRDSPAAQWVCGLGLEDEIEALLQFDATRTVPQLRDGVFVAPREVTRRDAPD